MTASEHERPGAESGRITESAVDRLRERIGVEVPGIRLGNTEATRDAIVNYSRGIGDLNPLFRDQSYAAGTRWGDLVAPPTFLRYMGDRDPHRAESVRSSRSGGGDPLAGVHGFFSGVELHFVRPLRRGDALQVRGGLARVELKDSRMGGSAVHETYDKVCWNQHGELIGLTRDLHIRIERHSARSRGSNMDADVPKHYTADEIAQIEADYDREYIRGPVSRFVEDVSIGDTSVPLVKGPYTVTSFIVFLAGTGLLRSRFFHIHSEFHAERKKHPKGFLTNPLGIPDSVAVVHWDKEMAHRAGVPERYDAGAERIAWMSQAVTHWMGDDAFLQRLQVSLRGFLYVGDTLWITCTVEAKSPLPAGGGSVRLRLEGRTQRDHLVVSGEADVLVPSRVTGMPDVVVRDYQPVSPFEEGGPNG